MRKPADRHRRDLLERQKRGNSESQKKGDARPAMEPERYEGTSHPWQQEVQRACGRHLQVEHCSAQQDAQRQEPNAQDGECDHC